MPNQNGYNIAIWNIFLKDNFGFGIIKQQWEMMPSMDAILVINQSLNEVSASFPRELNKFGIWTYYTGYRTIPNSKFFEEEEAINYPMIRPSNTIAFFPPSQMLEIDAQPTSNNFIKFNISANGDTLFSIITNGDVNSATDLFSPQFVSHYTLFSDSSSGERKLTDNYSSTFSTANPNWWTVSEILNDVVVREDSTIKTIPSVSGTFAFPNPFKYIGRISISLNAKSNESVSFNVYTSGMKLVYTADEVIKFLSNNTLGIYWDGLDNSDNKLASGVYIYVIKQGDEVVKGKVVIFNE